ncbi:hypothetical protein [Vibrio harveyi]|uniref:hypothetical protein n=1 Tax=Vibrio harveyi TaxID=669 RepID=UPI000C798757|nr:hypothetical protein [Vibrio harveyi]MDG2608236.1 hypothetical protein [Vibrio parahaemolyticus]
MKKTILSALILGSMLPTYAHSFVFLQRESNPDGYAYEWNDPQYKIEFKDLDMIVSVNQFTDTFFFRIVPQEHRQAHLSSYSVLIKGENKYFELGDKFKIQIKYQDKKTKKFLKEKRCNIGLCDNVDVVSKTYSFFRNKQTRAIEYDGVLKKPLESYAYRKVGNEEFLELFTSDPYYLSESKTVGGTRYYPTLVITAVNGLSGADKVLQGNHFGKNMDLMCARSAPRSSAVWDVYKPSTEDYLRDVPDIKPVVQGGISIQAPNFDIDVAVTTDFKDLSLSVAPGLSLNTDTEFGGFVNGYATTNLDDVTTGTSTTVSGDLGVIGGSLVYDANNRLIGGGLTFEVGVPDADISVNEGVEIATTKTKSKTDNKRTHRQTERRGGYDRRHGRTSHHRGEGGHSIEH